MSATMSSLARGAAGRIGISVFIASATVILHGCGGGGGPPSPSPSPSPAPVPPGPPLPLRPLRSISYKALPCRGYTSGPLPAHDLVQEGYAPQWGPEGRDDLGMMKTLGGNAVRLYHSLGLETQHKHSTFLDRAQELGMHVIPGFHTQMQCSNFDCYQSWYEATLKALDDTQFMKNGTWHPAVAMLVLQDRPDDLNFVGAAADSCKEKPQNRCWLRAVLSAMDGVLAAEKQKGLKNVTVNLTVSWSAASRDSIDGAVSNAIGYFGFQDVMVGVKDPSLAKYTPRSDKKELAAAFATRWTHSLHVESRWEFIKGKIDPVYKQFEPTPWYISGWATDTMSSSDVTADLQAMDAYAQKSSFLGTTVEQFQFEYQTNGTDGGLFNLGNASGPEASTQSVCEEDVRTGSPICSTWPVHCLQENHGLADGVAAAWHGSVKGRGMCKSMLQNVVV